MRNVSTSVTIGVRFGGVLQNLGWSFFGMGMLFVWVFGSKVDVSPIVYAVSPIERVEGTVQGIESANMSVNEVSIYAAEFTFVGTDGVQYTSYSYEALGDLPPPGTVVPVEVPTWIPKLARIEGTQRGAVGMGIGLMVLIFPIIGLGMLGYAIPRQWRAAKLLTTGTLTQGLLLEKKPTNTRINKQTVYAMTLEFTDVAGNAYKTVSKTHEPSRLEDDAMEWILYDPTDPTRASTVDDLPGHPRVTEDGAIVGSGSAGSLIVAALAIGVNAVGLVAILSQFVAFLLS